MRALSLFFFISFSLQASEIATLPANLGVDETARIQALIESSKATRASIDVNGRNVASLNAEDRFWANEFDKIMSDESGKDYLDLCLEL